MKNLHITNTNKFVEPYIQFINRYFDANKNKFLVIINNNKKFNKSYLNVEYIRKKSLIHLTKQLYKSNHIYLHGLFNMKVIFILFIQPWLLKKCSWIVWGGDLYRYRDEKDTLKLKIYEFFRKRVIRKMGRILPLVEGDFHLAKQWYGVTNNYKIAKYVMMDRNIYINELLMRNNNRRRENSTLKIQVGNSASKNNRHLEAFHLLEKFKDNNIEIYCPLSYGDPENAKLVKKIGYEIFGNKFIPLERYMDIEEYLEHMSEIDVGVFNNDRQQGFGNINELLFLKKKVFINSGNTLWNYFNEQGIEVISVDEIKNISFEDFKYLSEFKREKNHKLIKHRFSNEYTRLVWEEIFSET